MVKCTQTIRRLLPKNCLSVLDDYVGLALKVLTEPKYEETSFKKAMRSRTWLFGEQRYTMV